MKIDASVHAYIFTAWRYTFRNRGFESRGALAARQICFRLQYIHCGAAATSGVEEGVAVQRHCPSSGGRKAQRPDEPTTGHGHHHKVSKAKLEVRAIA